MKQIIFSFLCFAASFELCGKAVFSPLFGDHAVLAKREIVPVWGSAEPGEKVKVSIAGISAETTAGKNGRWMVRLNLSECGNGPFELRANDTVSRDVLIGSVYLASGQSNMTLQVQSSADSANVIRNAKDDKLRYFDVVRSWKNTPQSELKGKWEIVSPDNVWRFSALAYHFAAAIRQKTASPVGIVHSSLGGTPIEAWMSVESLADFPDMLALKQRVESRNAAYPQKEKAYLQDLLQWEKQLNRSDKRFPPVPQNNWQKTKMQSLLLKNGGVVWIKFKLPVTALQVNKTGINTVIGRPDCIIDIYLNGKRVSGNNPLNVARKDVFFVLPRKGSFEGDNEIAIRLFNSGSSVSIPMPFTMGSKKFEAGKGEWEIHVEKEFPPLSPEEIAKRPVFTEKFMQMDRFPTQLYNGMIHPLHPLALTAIIWYHGESGVNNPGFYGKAFRNLIGDWRKRFENPELPFLFCQLASHHPKTVDPNNAGWARLRSVQTAALQLKNTGMAVLTDAGESEDIHPQDKSTPAGRLAAAAMVLVYGKNDPYQGPEARSASAADGSVTVFFECHGADLVAKDLPQEYIIRRSQNRTGKLLRNSPAAQVENFSLCNAKGQWFWADQATVNGNTVIVKSKAVPDPVKVRYNWCSNPSGNLYSSTGFPAVPFELDVK